MGISTHVLDLVKGAPAQGLRVTLDRIVDERAARRGEGITSADGRCGHLIADDQPEPGVYELRFHVGAYFHGAFLDGASLDGASSKEPGPPAFLDIVPIRFGVAAGVAHYHIPLLITPWGYTTYRGS